MSTPMLPEQVRALRAVANAPAEGESALLRGYLRTVLDEAEELRTALNQSENDVTGANLSLWEEEQDAARLRLALESARRGRRQARARVAELEAERHSTNEALDDAVREVRARQGDELTEYGIRVPGSDWPEDGVLLDGDTFDRGGQTKRLGRYRACWPAAELVARVVTRGPWAAVEGGVE